MQLPEIWASPEPTVARIDRVRTRDQLRETGHEARETDIDLLAGLGVHATRYPVLWEKVASHHPHVREYGWASRRLNALAERGVEPIVTLLHHGSGPDVHEPDRPRIPAAVRRLRGRDRAPLSVGEALDADQRAADDGALLDAVRGVVPERVLRPRRVRARDRQRGARHRAAPPSASAT